MRFYPYERLFRGGEDYSRAASGQEREYFLTVPGAAVVQKMRFLRNEGQASIAESKDRVIMKCPACQREYVFFELSK